MLVYEKGDYGYPLFQKLAAQLTLEVTLETVALPQKPVDADRPMMRGLLDKASKSLMRIGAFLAI